MRLLLHHQLISFFPFIIQAFISHSSEKYFCCFFLFCFVIVCFVCMCFNKENSLKNVLPPLPLLPVSDINRGIIRH